MGKNLLAMKETLVESLGQEDPMMKGMATHSNILAWRIPWIDHSVTDQESDMTEQLMQQHV